MILINVTMVGLFIYEGIELIKQGLKKEFVIYIIFCLFVIGLELLCLLSPPKIKLYSILLELFD